MLITVDGRYDFGPPEANASAADLVSRYHSTSYEVFHTPPGEAEVLRYFLNGDESFGLFVHRHTPVHMSKRVLCKTGEAEERDEVILGNGARIATG